MESNMDQHSSDSPSQLSAQLRRKAKRFPVCTACCFIGIVVLIAASARIGSWLPIPGYVSMGILMFFIAVLTVCGLRAATPARESCPACGGRVDIETRPNEHGIPTDYLVCRRCGLSVCADVDAGSEEEA